MDHSRPPEARRSATRPRVAGVFRWPRGRARPVPAPCGHGPYARSLVSLAPRWRAEDGQAAALAALALGGFLILLLWGGIGVAALVQDRAALSAAADAAALAARQATASVTATLEVRFSTHRCVERWSGAGRGARRTLVCTATPGTAMVWVDGAAFAPAGGGQFGADPGWAAAADCVGVRWQRPAEPGTWRICLAQELQTVSLAPAAAAALRAAAQAWLTADGRIAGLSGARVAAVETGAGGQVTVRAVATVDVPLFGSRTLQASATAWPGT